MKSQISSLRRSEGFNKFDLNQELNRTNIRQTPSSLFVTHIYNRLKSLSVEKNKWNHTKVLSFYLCIYLDDSDLLYAFLVTHCSLKKEHFLPDIEALWTMEGQEYLDHA